ncbi:hypothetical protein BH09ACT12_BH09ACT12_17970 [soil metagenome]
MHQPPVPIRFELPSADWQPVDPAGVGVTNVIFFAARGGVEGDFTPTLSVSGGWRRTVDSLADMGDQTLAKIAAEGATDVELVDRRQVESDTAPMLSQTVGATAVVEGRRFDLRQTQVILGYVDLERPERTAIFIHTLTCTFKQSPVLAEEFRTYLASVAPVAPTEKPGPSGDPTPA